MSIIKTMNGNICYKTHPLYLGIKKINKVIARENLLLFKEIAESHELFFGLIGGTLLGAVREHDFIEHDEDIDLFLKEEDKQFFFGILPQLLEIGFRIARYDRRGLLSIIRKGEYIDLCFFSDYVNGICICSGWCIPEHFLLDNTTLFFQDSQFIVPKDYIAYLKFEYGENWLTPIPYTDFNLSLWEIKLFELKEKIKGLLPDWAYFYLVRKSERKLIHRSLCKIEQYRNSLE